MLAITHVIAVLSPQPLWTRPVTLLPIPSRGASARPCHGVTLPPSLAGTRQETPWAVAAVITPFLAVGASITRRTNAGAGVMHAGGTVLTQAGELALLAEASWGTPVLTRGAGEARRTHAQAGDAVAGAAVVAEADVLAGGAPAVGRARPVTLLPRWADAVSRGRLAGASATLTHATALTAPEPRGTRLGTVPALPSRGTRAGAGHGVARGVVLAPAAHGTVHAVRAFRTRFPALLSSPSRRAGTVPGDAVALAPARALAHVGAVVAMPSWGAVPAAVRTREAGATYALASHRITRCTVETSARLSATFSPPPGPALPLARLTRRTPRTLASPRHATAGTVALTLALLQAVHAPQAFRTGQKAVLPVEAGGAAALPRHRIAGPNTALAHPLAAGPETALAARPLATGSREASWTLLEASTRHVITPPPVLADTGVLAVGSPATRRAEVGAVPSRISRLAFTLPVLRPAETSALDAALALMAAVGTPRHTRAGHVAVGSESSRVTLTEPEDPIATRVRALDGTAASAGLSKEACGTAILTPIPQDSWRTYALPRLSITGSSVLALTHLLAVLPEGSRGTRLLAVGPRPPRGTHAPPLAALAGALVARGLAAGPEETPWTAVYDSVGDIGVVFDHCHEVPILFSVAARGDVFSYFHLLLFVHSPSLL